VLAEGNLVMRKTHIINGALEGQWDCPRISQALTNLIGNALEHGSDRTLVTVDVRGDDEELAIAVHNKGAAIPADVLKGFLTR
jgi:signal transduction histidine kinase